MTRASFNTFPIWLLAYDFTNEEHSISIYLFFPTQVLVVQWNFHIAQSVLKKLIRNTQCDKTT